MKTTLKSNFEEDYKKIVGSLNDSKKDDTRPFEKFYYRKPESGFSISNSSRPLKKAN